MDPNREDRVKKSFTTKPGKTPSGQIALLELPFDPKAVFGKARAPVVCTLNGQTSWRTTIAVYGGVSFIGVRREIREAAGLEAGKPVRVTVELDEEPRVVEAPPELKKALKGTKAAAWKKLSFTHQREWVQALADAKKPETKARRLEQLLAKLG
ncbi:MAG: YdeI/OmpD-associated family protein [Myxococcaceae bacterium]